MVQSWFGSTLLACVEVMSARGLGLTTSELATSGLGNFLNEASVNLSAKTEYACIAMLALAAHYESTEPVRIRSIAEAHDIPSRFLVQILLQLKGTGYVASTRGAAGGYRLIKPPESITLADVMCVFEPSMASRRNVAESTNAVAATLEDVWTEAADKQLASLRSVTFAELVERAQGRSNNMYYI